MSVILLSEALRILHSGATCSITYVTADYKRGTGGQLVHIPACVIWSQKNITEPGSLVSPSSGLGNQDAAAAMVGVPTNHTDNKNPSHWIHKTRNIYIPKTQKIQKLHIKLITQFNGKKVLL